MGIVVPYIIIGLITFFVFLSANEEPAKIPCLEAVCISLFVGAVWPIAWVVGFCMMLSKEL